MFDGTTGVLFDAQKGRICTKTVILSINPVGFLAKNVHKNLLMFPESRFVRTLGIFKFLTLLRDIFRDSQRLITTVCD